VGLHNCQSRSHRAWGDPGARTLEQYIPITQNYVATLFRIALDPRTRSRNKYETAGISFSSIRHLALRPKAAVDLTPNPAVKHLSGVPQVAIDIQILLQNGAKLLLAPCITLLLDAVEIKRRPW